LVTLPTPLTASGSPRLPFWLLACLGYAVGFVIATRGRLGGVGMRLALAAEASCAVTMMGLLCNGYEGSLLVVIAAQLGFVVRASEAGAWICAQTVAAGVAIGLHWSPRPALLIMPPYLGLQIFASFTVLLLARERATRGALANSHARVTTLQLQLADKARLDERLRIAQDLHDTLGHRLTATALNLEAAAHQTEGPATDRVRTAQTLVRAVLSDVRDIARALRIEPDVDLEAELTMLAQEIPSPRIHLALPEGFHIDAPEVAGTLLRCAQEIVTNAIRHGSARNLWIEVAQAPSGLELNARDDGVGVAELQLGNGLRGMRRRLEELGGQLYIEGSPARGFTVRATLPLSRP
jgi:signal transduction histidine kinase